MDALNLYVSTARSVFQYDCRDNVSTNGATANEQSIQDVLRLLPQLRQSLCCAVCSHVLNDPFSPKDGRCEHNVCRLCVRGQKQMHPVCEACKDCQDFNIYHENKQMRCVLLCYKSLCEQLMGSSLFQQICKQSSQTTGLTSGLATPILTPREIITEGASYDDILNVFGNDLPRQKFVPTMVLPMPSTSHSTNAALIPISVTALPMPKAAVTLSTPQQQHQLTHTYPVKISIMNEHASPPITTASTISVTKTPAFTTAASTPKIKTLKNVVDLPSALQISAASIASSSTLPQTVTYMSQASASSVVMPLLSASSPSSTLTTAPLTIASAKLQSLSRQLAVQQQRNYINVGSNTHDIKTTTAPIRFKLASTPTTVPITTVATISHPGEIITTTATVTSQTMCNPPPIKTVSNGSAMYSVLYTGIGNKITIKRKTDGDDDANQKKNFCTPPVPPQNALAVFRPISKANAKRRGCRCGNATATPGKLTCCGQRCPCYVDSKSCIGCKCRGCRNPHRPDGGKVCPVIPELACYEIQMADSEHSSLSPGELPIATSQSNKPTTAAATASIPPPTISNTLSVQQVNLPLESLISSTTQLQSQVSATGRLTIAPTTSSTTTSTASSILYRSRQQISIVQQQKAQTSTNATINTIVSQQQQQQLQANVLQLDNLQRESLLIQSAGKYQVVNVFTPATSHHHSSTGLQRIQTLQTVGTSASNVIPSNSNPTFLIQSNSNGVGGCSTSSSMHLHKIPEISTTLPQIIMQQPPTHQQQQQQQPTQRTQLHQQVLKSQNNVITVHPIINSVKPTATAISPSAITLSPLLVASPNTTFTSTDLFSESSGDEYLNDVNINSTVLDPITSMSASTMPHVSQYAIANNNNGSVGQSQYVEIIDSTDL